MPLPRILTTLLLVAGLLPAGAAEPPSVVATIKPVHSLAAGVMQGVAEPLRLLPETASPHSYALRPSEARALAQADLVFWIGPGLETFLTGTLDGLPEPAYRRPLIETPGLDTLPIRRGGLWGEGHDHGHDHRHTHGDEGPGHEGHDHGDATGEIDPHLWLDPRNARALVAEMARVLSAVDPQNAERYRSNATTMDASLAALEDELAPLRSLGERPFVVYHDAFQYLEHRFGLRALGALIASPGVGAGVRRVQGLRAEMRSTGVLCVFAEPQFAERQLGPLLDADGVRLARLDPMGVGLADGPEAYAGMMRGLRDALLGCLATD
jgi:zinc transport system substrate-binding protein